MQTTLSRFTMTLKTNIQAGGFGFSRSGTMLNHNQTQVRAAR